MPDRLPKALHKMLAALTEEDKLRKFRYAFNREPASDDELEAWIVELARGLYNDDYDEWPENDEELA
jgi:hypothetical protein